MNFILWFQVILCIQWNGFHEMNHDNDRKEDLIVTEKAFRGAGELASQ